MSPPPAERVVVHSSWRGLATAVASPLLLLAFAAATIASGGPGPAALVVLALGLVLLGGVLADYPRRAEFTPTGVDRVCFLRTQHLPWSELVAIERTPPGVRSALRRAGDAGDAAAGPATRGPRVRGGLVARGLGRRRYLLTDRVEGALEFDALAGLLRRLGVATSLRAPRPALDTPPSDLYRRSRRQQERP